MARPTNLTGRVWLDYTDGINEHSLMVRHQGPNGLENAVAGLQGLLSIIGQAFYSGWAVRGLRQAAAGSDISLPLEEQLNVPATTSPVMPAINAPRFISFGGRDTQSGQPTRWFFYGVILPNDPNYRIEQGESLVVADVVDFLDSLQGSGAFCSNDGGRLAVYRYANWGYNAYWQRESRI